MNSFRVELHIYMWMYVKDLHDRVFLLKSLKKKPIHGRLFKLLKVCWLNIRMLILTGLPSFGSLAWRERNYSYLYFSSNLSFWQGSMKLCTVITRMSCDECARQMIWWKFHCHWETQIRGEVFYFEIVTNYQLFFSWENVVQKKVSLPGHRKLYEIVSNSTAFSKRIIMYEV